MNSNSNKGRTRFRVQPSRDRSKKPCYFKRKNVGAEPVGSVNTFNPFTEADVPDTAFQVPVVRLVVDCKVKDAALVGHLSVTCELA
jgi:hypothetical protein